MSFANGKETPTVLVLLGPTGSGKTEALSRLVSAAPASDKYEIVSCDSRQIYKGLETATAAPEKSLQEKLPHHLVSIFSPKESIAAGQFARLARQALQDIFRRKKTPILAGGSGFYFRALKTGMFPVETPPQVRCQIDAMPVEQRLKKLQELDPEALLSETPLPKGLSRESSSQQEGKIHPNDTYRITRALEIIFSSQGKKWSAFWKEAREALPTRKKEFQFCGFWMDIAAEKHKNMIYQRAKNMAAKGLVKEIGAVYEKHGQCPGLKSLGCQEALSVYFGKSTIEELPEKLAQSHYRYGKKQKVWLKKEKSLKAVLSEDFPEKWKELESSLPQNL